MDFPSTGELDEFCANLPIDQQDEILSHYLKEQFPDIDMENIVPSSNKETDDPSTMFDAENMEFNSIMNKDPSTMFDDEAELSSINPLMMHISGDHEHSDVENFDVTINRDIIENSVIKIMKKNDLIPFSMVSDSDMKIVKEDKVSVSHDTAGKPLDRRFSFGQISKENSYSTSPIIVSANNSVLQYPNKSLGSVKEFPRSNLEMPKKAVSAPGSILSANNSVLTFENRSPGMESVKKFPRSNAAGSVMNIDVTKPPPSRGVDQVGRRSGPSEADAAGNYDDYLDASEDKTEKKEPEISFPPLKGKMVWIWNKKMRRKNAEEIRVAFDIKDEIGVDRIMKKAFEAGEPTDMVYVLKTFQEEDIPAVFDLLETSEYENEKLELGLYGNKYPYNSPRVCHFGRHTKRKF